jgi:predicted outer membrane protein
MSKPHLRLGAVGLVALTAFANAQESKPDETQLAPT